MLSGIRRFFDEFMTTDPAALLLEMAHMDETLKPEEHDAVLRAVHERFELSPEEADGLIDCAEAERLEATDYHQFTSLIKAHFGAAERIALVEQLWRVAYADERLCKHEEYLVRKVADLLHVPHSAFISAKHRVQREAEG